MLLWIIICGVLIYKHLESLGESAEVITHMTVGIIIMTAGLWTFVLASALIPKLGEWGDKKIFKKND